MSVGDRTPVMRRHDPDDFPEAGPSRRSRSRSPSRRDRAHHDRVRGSEEPRHDHGRIRSTRDTYSTRHSDRKEQETSSQYRETYLRESYSREARKERDSRDQRVKRDYTPERDRDKGETRHKDKSRESRHHRRDSDSRRTRHHSADRSRDRSKRRRRRHRGSQYSDEGSSSGSSVGSEDDRRRRRRKDRKKDKSSKSKTVASTSTWGKYGVINEANISSKQTELRTWLIEERKLNPETLSKDRLRRETLVFIEDYNTASFPHEKFYNIEAYKIKVEMIRTGQTLPLDLNSYDATADLKAHTSRVKAEKQKEKKLSREEVEELRQIEKERVEIGRMRLLGMDVSRTLGVRTDYVKREEMVFDDKPFP